jgi:hypothetical protein
MSDMLNLTSSASPNGGHLPPRIDALLLPTARKWPFGAPAARSLSGVKRISRRNPPVLGPNCPPALYMNLSPPDTSAFSSSFHFHLLSCTILYCCGHLFINFCAFRHPAHRSVVRSGISCSYPCVRAAQTPAPTRLSACTSTLVFSTTLVVEQRPRSLVLSSASKTANLRNRKQSITAAEKRRPLFSISWIRCF